MPELKLLQRSIESMTKMCIHRLNYCENEYLTVLMSPQYRVVDCQIIPGTVKLFINQHPPRFVLQLQREYIFVLCTQEVQSLRIQKVKGYTVAFFKLYLINNIFLLNRVQIICLVFSFLIKQYCTNANMQFLQGESTSQAGGQAWTLGKHRNKYVFDGFAASSLVSLQPC